MTELRSTDEQACEVADQLVRLYVAEPAARAWVRLSLLDAAVKQADPHARATMLSIADAFSRHADGWQPTPEP